MSVCSGHSFSGLAEFVHRDESLSPTLRLAFWWPSPQGSRQGNRKCTRGRNYVNRALTNLFLCDILPLLYVDTVDEWCSNASTSACSTIAHQPSSRPLSLVTSFSAKNAPKPSDPLGELTRSTLYPQ